MYMFLAIGHFKHRPPLLPIDRTGTNNFSRTNNSATIFWHRSRDVKAQICKYLASALLVGRTSWELGVRARRFASR